MTDKNTIKQWFKTTLKPTQEQFWAWQDSYWHKSESIPQIQIEDLAETLGNKADATQLEAKANKDASNIDVNAYKQALNVQELPSNLATVDEGNKVGNVHTKEQIQDLLENSGKNISNSNLTTTKPIRFEQEHDFTWFVGDSRYLLGTRTDTANFATFVMQQQYITLISHTGSNEIRFIMDSDGFQFYNIKNGNSANYQYVMGLDSQGKAAKLPAGDLGKNMGNSQLVTTAQGGITQGANYNWDTAGYYLYLKNLPNKSQDSTFNEILVQDSNGQVAVSNGKVLFKNLPNLMTAEEKKEWMKKWTGVYSTNAPLVDVITFPIIEKGGVQELNLWGSNLYIDPEISHIRIKQKSNLSNWHSADSFTVKTSGNISFKINTELLTVGEEYVVEVKHGNLITVSNFSFLVVAEMTPMDISNLNWIQINDDEADTYNRTTREGNSFFVENLAGASAQTGYRNKVVRRFKSEKVLDSGENAVFTFSSNINYSAGNFEFPLLDYDTFGIGEYLESEPASTRSSSIKAYFMGGGKPVNVALQNNSNRIVGGNATVLIVKRNTSIFTSIQVEDSVIFMTTNLIKDINVSVEFQTVARYLRAKSIGTYALDSIYKF